MSILASILAHCLLHFAYASISSLQPAIAVHLVSRYPSVILSGSIRSIPPSVCTTCVSFRSGSVRGASSALHISETQPFSHTCTIPLFSSDSNSMPHSINFSHTSISAPSSCVTSYDCELRWLVQWVFAEVMFYFSFVFFIVLVRWREDR